MNERTNKGTKSPPTYPPTHPYPRVLDNTHTHKGPVWAITFNVSGTRIATGGQDGKVVIWDLTAPQEVANLAAPEMVNDTTSTEASEERPAAPDGSSVDDGDDDGLCPEEGAGGGDGSREEEEEEGVARSSGGGGAPYPAAVNGVGRTGAFRDTGLHGPGDEGSAGRQSCDSGLGSVSDGKELSLSGLEVGGATA